MSLRSDQSPQPSSGIRRIEDARAPFFWGIDIGGTGIKLGLVDEQGDTVAYEKIPTREAEGGPAAVERIAKIVQEAEQRLGVVGQVPQIGLGAPGPMDLPNGTRYRRMACRSEPSTAEPQALSSQPAARPANGISGLSGLALVPS